MIERCHKPESKDYKWYGAKGVSVCDAWRDDFWRFVADVGARPSPQHSLDRVDTAGAYQPGNVRWATQLEQQRNRTNNRRYEYEGKQWTAAELAGVFGISLRLMRDRLEKGWSVEEIRSAPLTPGKRYVRPGARPSGYRRSSETVRRVSEARWPKRNMD